MRKLKTHFANVFHYFGQFSYAPTFNEIYTFFPEKINKKDLSMLLEKARKAGELLLFSNKQAFSLPHGSSTNYELRTNCYKYTLPQYSMRRQSKVESQKSKVIGRILQIYIYLLKVLPLVRFVGMTGKSAVEGVRNNDDIDLFIVTKRGLLWTARFCVVILAKFLGIHGGTGVCLNLFFDESNLTVSGGKQNEYVAHELLQMKPIIDKQNTYSALMGANEWIYALFPNAPQPKAKSLKLKAQNKNYELSTTHYALDVLAKSLQLPLIRKNKTGFRITPTQLWLFRRDFEKKLKKIRLV